MFIHIEPDTRKTISLSQYRNPTEPFTQNNDTGTPRVRGPFEHQVSKAYKVHGLERTGVEIKGSRLRF